VWFGVSVFPSLSRAAPFPHDRESFDSERRRASSSPKSEIIMRKAANFSRTFSVLALLTLAACEQKREELPKTTSSTPAASALEATHAHAAVKPGSYDDWCGEHKVPESLCSRCNPALVAAFKATGDWCNEHGLPESQCLICNPDLKIERPPKPGEANP
jgi:hypothetical protein